MIADSGDREELVAKTRTLLEFLEKRGLTSEVDERGPRTVVAYVGHPLTFEAELDWLDGAAFLLVGRSPDGQRPGGYYLDANGRRVRVHLMEALRKAGLLTSDKERILKGVMCTSGKEAMARQVTILSSELRESMDALAGKAEAIFASR